MTIEWRLAVREAMRGAAEEESRQRSDGTIPTFNYRWEHVSTVATLAIKLARLLQADEEVVEAAAWLHDVTKHDGESHARTGADFAREFLVNTDFPTQKIEGVSQAIAEHKGLWRDEPLATLESMVLWDADKLSKIGLTAVFHWTGLALSNGTQVTMADLLAKSRHADWQAKTVGSMHTEPARRAALSRLKAFNQLWEDLEAELNGDDLVRDEM